MLRVPISRPGEGRSHCVASGQTALRPGRNKRGTPNFVVDDVTHVVLESIPGCRFAVFALIDSGWDIADTTRKGSRGSLRPEAIEVETIVVLPDSKRAAGTV